VADKILRRVAQDGILLYRGFPIRDTAEYNSALLRLRLRRAKHFCGYDFKHNDLILCG
jgi:hypothetical protein